MDVTQHGECWLRNCFHRQRGLFVRPLDYLFCLGDFYGQIELSCPSLD